MRYGTEAKENVSTVRRTQAYIIRGPKQQTVMLPGEFIEVNTPEEMEPDHEWTVEPRFDFVYNYNIKKPKHGHLHRLYTLLDTKYD